MRTAYPRLLQNSPTVPMLARERERAYDSVLLKKKNMKFIHQYLNTLKTILVIPLMKILPMKILWMQLKH